MKPWIRKIGKDGKPPSWRPADDVRAPYRSGHVEAKTRAKKAVKCSISLRRMGLSTSLILLVGLRRPLAFGLPVPLRVQSLGYGSVQRSAFRVAELPPLFECEYQLAANGLAFR